MVLRRQSDGELRVRTAMRPYLVTTPDRRPDRHSRTSRGLIRQKTRCERSQPKSFRTRPAWLPSNRSTILSAWRRYSRILPSCSRSPWLAGASQSVRSFNSPYSLNAHSVLLASSASSFRPQTVRLRSSSSFLAAGLIQTQRPLCALLKFNLVLPRDGDCSFEFFLQRLNTILRILDDPAGIFQL